MRFTKTLLKTWNIQTKILLMIGNKIVSNQIIKKKKKYSLLYTGSVCTGKDFLLETPI